MGSPLFNAGPGGILESGIFPSLPPGSAPFWADGENVEFRDGGVVSSTGYSPLATFGGTIGALAQAYHEGDQRLYASVGRNIYNASSRTGVDQIGELPALGTPYFETLGSWLAIANDLNPVMLWKNTGMAAAIAGTPFNRAKLLKRADNHLMVFNTNLGGNHYAWSDTSNFEEFTPATDNAAGDNYIRDLDGDILAVTNIGNRYGAYSNDTLALISFIGQPYIFGHQPAINGVGAVGGRSVTAFGAENAGLTKQGIFRTDGFSFSYVDEPAVHEYIQETVDFSKGEEIRSYHAEELSSVYFYFTKLESGRAGIGWNYKKGIFTKSSLAIENVLERQVFSHAVGAAGSTLVLFDRTNNANGVPFRRWVRTRPLEIGHPNVWRLFSYLQLNGNWTTDAQVRFGLVEDPNAGEDDIQWFSTQTIGPELFVDREVPYLVIELSVETLNGFFKVSKMMGWDAGAFS